MEPLAIARTLTALDKIESSALDSGIIRVTEMGCFPCFAVTTDDGKDCPSTIERATSLRRVPLVD
jgi:hypothetical protein